MKVATEALHLEKPLANELLPFTSRISNGAALHLCNTHTVCPRIYFASEIEPPTAFTFINFFGFLWIVGWWLLTDSRKRGLAWVYDIGFFLSIAWPFIMPYYLLKTRGAKGLLLILAFVAVYIGSLIAGMALYLLLAPPTG